MQFGSERTSIKIYHDGEERAMRHYKVRVKVTSTQEEMSEFIRFTKELSELKDKLTWDKEDPMTRPSFIIEHTGKPSYFIVKCWTIVD